METLEALRERIQVADAAQDSAAADAAALAYEEARSEPRPRTERIRIPYFTASFVIVPISA